MRNYNFVRKMKKMSIFMIFVFLFQRLYRNISSFHTLIVAWLHIFLRKTIKEVSIVDILLRPLPTLHFAKIYAKKLGTSGVTKEFREMYLNDQKPGVSPRVSLKFKKTGFKKSGVSESTERP